MRAAHSTIAFFLLAIAGLLLLRFSPGESQAGENPAIPDLGSLAPVSDPPPELIERARFVPEVGDVVDLAAKGEETVFLATKGWYYQSGSTARGWFGDATSGSPTWLDRAISVAIGDGEVFILDERRSLLSVWDTLGNQTGERQIPIRSDLIQSPRQVVMGPEGVPLLIRLGVNMDGAAAWTVLSLDSNGGTETMDSLPSREEGLIFREPRLAVGSGILYALDPLEWSLSSYNPTSSRFFPLSQRAAPPLWFVPAAQIREYNLLLARMSGTLASLSALPKHWPSVRDFTVRSDGTFLVVTTATEELVHIEHLNSAMEPIGRFNLDGFNQPVFLSDGRAFIVEEDLDQTVVYEFVF